MELMLIKTDKCCFVSDCYAKEGSYNHSYHNSIIPSLLFDNESPIKTWSDKWYKISHFPTKIEKEVKGEKCNVRYEIRDKDNVTKKFPEVINYDDSNNYSDDILDNLYSYTYDEKPNYKVDTDIKVKTLCEIDNFVDFCDFDFKAIGKFGWDEKQYHIKHADINHQMIDEIILPDVLLENKPCSLSSKQMYDITRQYVREHIDSGFAQITSDYDFCFTVKKNIPLLEPKTISYQHIFAKTKKERNKIHYKTAKVKSEEIFQMTHDQENYKGYTSINGMFANSEHELKEKIDTWLIGLISLINKPLHQCEHCCGTGYIDEVEIINKNDMIDKINDTDESQHD
jgi:hypothetical protein